ncbi:acetylserotonin O-methyltransferase-like [Benincasa hispida]|uniref:acetylserotonin O-methyltransferase-like n=1 Tax=Benincasa hispida TaxID=102211 RepID=UPI0019006CA8|nr:acetylserotonin O-methyltransferase-like [Benincasa hispida]
MEETIIKESKWKKEEEEEVKIQIYKYVIGFAEAAAIKCAIELKIADAIESHGRPMSLSQLSTALNCSPPLLLRIMRFLVHRRMLITVFKEETTAENVIGYSQTPLSHMLITVAPLLVLENSPTIVESWHNLSARYNGVEHVAGNMLHFVPNADAAFFMWILHAWDDKDCIKILKNCKEAIPEDRGKVIIIDSVINEKEENKMLSDIRLTLDIMMMTRSQKERERTHDERTHLLINKASFSRCIITSIPHAVPSIIQAFMS